MMLKIPVSSAPEELGNRLSIVRDRIAVSAWPHKVINECEDLEVDHADELT